jgi:hypothetical protein
MTTANKTNENKVMVQSHFAMVVNQYENEVNEQHVIDM